MAALPTHPMQPWDWREMAALPTAPAITALAAAIRARAGASGPPFPGAALRALRAPMTTFHLYHAPGSPYHGWSTLTGGCAVIHLNTAQPPAEQAYTLAHEAGHVLLHLLPGRFAELPLPRRAGPPDPAQTEMEADLFADLVLAPDAWVRAAWPARPAALEAALGVPYYIIARRARALGL